MTDDFDHDLIFTIKFAMSRSKNWPGGKAAPSITELDGLAKDVAEQLDRSNVRITLGPRARDPATAARPTTIREHSPDRESGRASPAEGLTP